MNIKLTYQASWAELIPSKSINRQLNYIHEPEGRMRSASSWTVEPPTYGRMTDEGWDRGYTGHEHLPAFGIINMNGRLYDPVMGRMFSPDPYIMGADNTQGYNRGIIEII